MITLNDYLYSGDTVLKILKKYTEDLRQSAARTGNEVDVRHCEFLSQIMELLEHNDFLTAQSQKIREFYKYMAREYPYLSFTFKGRIKSLIRAEASSTVMLWSTSMITIRRTERIRRCRNCRNA